MSETGATRATSGKSETTEGSYFELAFLGFSLSQQDAQKGHPTRPQVSHNRRRTLRGTLRIVTNRERRWGPFSASCYELR
jgi:hypothetical protein